jgi:hypothetical protein
MNFQEGQARNPHSRHASRARQKEIFVTRCIHLPFRINLDGKTRLNTAKRNGFIKLPCPN